MTFFEAIKSVIYHEYMHQIIKEHNAKFNAKMKLFDGYDKYLKEIEDYFRSDLVKFSVKVMEDYCNEISETEYVRLMEEC